WIVVLFGCADTATIVIYALSLHDALPILVFAGWESHFAADTIGDRAELADLGVATYVAPAACQGDGYRPDPLTFDDVFAHVLERSEEHTSELQSRENLVCRLLLEKKKQ